MTRDTELGVAERLERLERKQRRQRRGEMLALLGLGAMALMGQAGMTLPTILDTKTLEAERIVLKDPKGNLRALLSVSDEGVAGLALVNEDGNAGVLLAATPDSGGQLLLADRGGVTRIELGPVKDEWALAFRDAREKPRARIGVTAERSQVELFGPGGQRRVAVVAPPPRPVAPRRVAPAPAPAPPPVSRPSGGGVPISER